MLMKSVMGWALRWSPRKEVEVAAVIDIISFLKYLFVYLAASGLRCSTQDLCCVLWDLPHCTHSMLQRMDLLAVAHGFQQFRHAGLVATPHVGSYFPD